jgi:hypothetical protein
MMDFAMAGTFIFLIILYVGGAMACIVTSYLSLKNPPRKRGKK